MRKILLISIILLIGKASFGVIDTLRHYNPATATYAMTAYTNNIYFARFEPKAPGYVKQIIIKLGGTSTNGSVRLSFYSHEAGTSFPQLFDTLFPSFTIHKTRTGIEDIVVNLPQTLWYDNNQFFIGMSKVSTNVKLICDNSSPAYSCSSTSGGDFYYMFYYSGSQAYLGAKKAFAIDVVMDCPILTTSDYFKAANTSAGLPALWTSGSGAWSDYNHDGYVDLLTTNILYKNNGNGTFTNVNSSSGITTNSTRGVVFADMNNDGNMDIIRLGEQGSGNNLSYVYSNDGTGHFTKDTLNTIPTLTAVSAVCVADANNDRYPDLFIAQIWDPYPVPQPNFFMMNNQNNGFIDSTTQIYPQHNGTYNWPNALWLPSQSVYERNRNNRGAEWADFNNDGKIDLYVTNYFLQKDELYKNNGNGSFTDVINSTIIDKNSDGYSNHGTGVDWGDYDNDGIMDLLLPQFAHPAYARQYNHRGTTIYHNDGVAPNFTTYTDTRGNTGHLNKGAQGIQYEETHGGGAWGDYDNDGLLDFAITAFYGCRFVDIYHQKPDHTFELKSFELGSVNTLNTDDEVAWVDYDNDGKLDLCMGTGCYLFHNEYPSYNNWVEFDLVSTSGNHFSIGGRATIYAGGKTYMREITAGRGELAQNPSRIHIGLGTATQIDSVLVRWPNGTTNTEKFCVTGVNNIYTLTENTGGVASPLVIVNGNTSFCQGGSVALHTINNPNVTYQWQVNGTNVANANSSYINATQNGTYTLLISNGTSCIGTSNPVVVTVDSLPVVNAGIDVTIATGNDTTLTSVVTAGSGHYSYNWTPSNLLVSNNINNPQTNNLTASGIFTLVVTDSITGCVGTDNVSVMVSGGTLTAVCSATQITVCKDSSQLVVLPTGGLGNYTYTWDNVTLLSDSTISNPIATVSSSTTFTVTVSDGTSQITTQVTVTPPSIPTANITNTGSNNFCDGNSTTLSANTGTGINYQWQRNGLILQGDTNQTLNVFQAGIYNVLLSNNSGCLRTSDTLNISVLPAPTAHIIQTGVASICQNDSFTLYVDTASALTYQWLSNDSSITGQTGTSFIAFQSGLYSVVVSNGSCVDTSSQVQLYVHSLPTITINNSDTILCSGQSILLNTNSTGLTYQWKKNGVNINSAYTSSYTANQTGAYTVVASNNNCSATSNVVNVTVFTPVATITNYNDSVTLCQGQQYSLTADSTNGYNYQWLVNDTNIQNETNNNLNIIQQGVYSLIANKYGCADTSNDVNIIINQTPSLPTITQNVDTLISSSQFGNQWYLNGAILQGDTNQTLTIASTGIYQLVVTLNTCSSQMTDTTTYHFSAITNVIPDKLNLNIYPNPNDGHFTVELYSPVKADYNLKIINELGMEISNYDLTINGKLSKSIDIKELSSGIYFVVLKGKDGTDIKRKIVKN